MDIGRPIIYVKNRLTSHAEDNTYKTYSNILERLRSTWDKHDEDKHVTSAVPHGMISLLPNNVFEPYT